MRRVSCQWVLPRSTTALRAIAPSALPPLTPTPPHISHEDLYNREKIFFKVDPRNSIQDRNISAKDHRTYERDSLAPFEVFPLQKPLCSLPYSGDNVAVSCASGSASATETGSFHNTKRDPFAAVHIEVAEAARAAVPGLALFVLPAVTRFQAQETLEMYQALDDAKTAWWSRILDSVPTSSTFGFTNADSRTSTNAFFAQAIEKSSDLSDEAFVEFVGPFAWKLFDSHAIRSHSALWAITDALVGALDATPIATRRAQRSSRVVAERIVKAIVNSQARWPFAAPDMTDTKAHVCQGRAVTDAGFL